MQIQFFCFLYCDTESNFHLISAAYCTNIGLVEKVIDYILKFSAYKRLTLGATY